MKKSNINRKATMTENIENSKLELLKHLHLVIRDELNNLRDRQNRIFTWSSYILLFVIGGLLIVDQSKIPVWANQGMLGKSIASAALFLVVMFSIRWQQRTRDFQEEVVETQNKIEYLLHCFEKDYYGSLNNVSLYPERWGLPKNYHKRVSFAKRVFRVNYVSATALLGILADTMVWLS